MGGRGLYATVRDYMHFIRIWLNDGPAKTARYLKKETILVAEKYGLGDKKIKMLPGIIPSLSNDAEFFPGMPKSWALTFMINDIDAPTGRPEGSPGQVLQICTIGSTAGTVLATSGRHKFFPSPTRHRRPATSILKPRLTKVFRSPKPDR